MKYLAYDDFTQTVLAEGSLIEVIPALAHDDNAGLAVLGSNGLRGPTPEEDAAALTALRAYAEMAGIAPREETAQAWVTAEEYLALMRGLAAIKPMDQGSPWRGHD